MTGRIMRSSKWNFLIIFLYQRKTFFLETKKSWSSVKKRESNISPIAGRISAPVAFSFQKWRICDMLKLSLVQHGIFQEEKVFVAMEECCWLVGTQTWHQICISCGDR